MGAVGGIEARYRSPKGRADVLGIRVNDESWRRDRRVVWLVNGR